MRFRPPHDRPLVIAFARAVLLPLAKHVRANGLTIQLTERARATLGALDGAAIIAPNHPTRDDPIVVFDVARQLGQRYNFMAAYEVFEEEGAVVSWLFQSCGIYSVVRGTIDRECFRTTRELLAAKRRRVVIFIEGTAPYQNDSLLPYQPGVVSFGFWAIEDAEKLGKPLPAMPIVPVVIKYVFRGDPLPKLERILTGLERDVLGESRKGPLPARVRNLGIGMLDALEAIRGLGGGATLAVGERVARLKQALLEDAERFAGITPRAGTSFTDRVFAVRRQADASIELDEKATAFRERLRDDRRRRMAFLYRDLDRLTLFSSFYDTYLSDYPSPERIADVLDRLHREVHAGRGAPLPPRTAMVDVAEPVDLVQHLGEYKSDRRATIAALTTRLETRARTLLEELFRRLTRPLESSADAAGQP